MPAELIPPTRTPLPAHWHRPGVYGVYSASGALQYVAAVADVGAAIAQHQRFIAAAASRHAVRMLTVDAVDDAPLRKIAEGWVLAHAGAAGVPPGNGDDAPEWRLEAPPGDVRIDPGARGAFVEQEIRRVLREHAVVVFMKGVREAPRCGFSAAVVDAVSAVVGDGFVCVDCLDERNGNLREAIKQFSGWPTLPQLYVDGEFVGGADIVRDMMAQGELQALLKRATGTE